MMVFLGETRPAVPFHRAFVLLAAALSLNATAPGPEHLAHQRVSMRDGARLDTDVFLPSHTGRFPVILVRTPYNKDTLPHYRSFLEHGYAVVTQDVRGRNLSEGLFEPLNQE